MRDRIVKISINYDVPPESVRSVAAKLLMDCGIFVEEKDLVIEVNGVPPPEYPVYSGFIFSDWLVSSEYYIIIPNNWK